MISTFIIKSTSVFHTQMSAVQLHHASSSMLLSILCPILFSRVIYADFTAQAWQSIGTTYSFPEDSYEYVASRPNVGVTFSGGGDRSFSATIGALGAFHELGYIENIKYMAGSSGGSWGVAVYSYYQHSFVNDSVMLGPIVFPADIVYDDLMNVDYYCVRKYPNSSYFDDSLLYSGWVDAVQAIYLDPAGILRGAPFSYNNESVSDIVLRNPSLASKNFMLQRGNFNESAPGLFISYYSDRFAYCLLFFTTSLYLGSLLSCLPMC